MSELVKPKRPDTKIKVTIKRAVLKGAWASLEYQAEVMECPVCNWQGDCRNFRTHCGTHHTESVEALCARLPEKLPGSYTVSCPWGCGKKMEKSSLETHRKAAHRDKPGFSKTTGISNPRDCNCPICDKQVTDVRSHISHKHRNEDGLIACPEPNCHALFREPDNLQDHIQHVRCSQDSKELEVCDHCGQPFNNCKSEEGRAVHLSGECKNRGSRKKFIAAHATFYQGDFEKLFAYLIRSAEQTIAAAGGWEHLGNGCHGPKLCHGLVKEHSTPGSYRQVKIFAHKKVEQAPLYMGAHEIAALKEASEDKRIEWMMYYLGDADDGKAPLQRDDAEHLCHTMACNQHCKLAPHADNVARVCNVLGPVHHSCKAGSADDKPELPCRFVHPHTGACHAEATLAHFQDHQERIRNWKAYCADPTNKQRLEWFLANAGELNAGTEPGDQYVMGNLEEARKEVKNLLKGAVKTSFKAQQLPRDARRHILALNGFIQQGAERTVALVSPSRPPFRTEHLNRLASSHLCHNPYCINPSHIQLEPAWLPQSRGLCSYEPAFVGVRGM
eukprot:TRINITY_DN585_c0_g1_i3.p1 TRINITY_DN585_c0_g1~~TRINITY_DN585_c0_g1_i3.p1  ORF type:complete len:607 (+),score=61.20 TRINITY_DN585_c0_g1_i3:149-1822(+)